MESTRLLDDKYLDISWNEHDGIIGLAWKESTASMGEEELKAELEVFADYVVKMKAPRLLIDVRKFQTHMSDAVTQWRHLNIAPRYNAAGAQREAFVLPENVPTSPPADKPAEGEDYLEGWFNSYDQATAWLMEA